MNRFNWSWIKKQYNDNKKQVLIVFLVMCVYMILFGNFRKESVDDPWVLSWIYHYWKEGVLNSSDFGGGGLLLFGKTQAIIYGPFLNLSGFFPNIAYLISNILILIAAFIWVEIFKKVGLKNNLAIIAISLMLLLEPFLFAANSARAEALTFFLITLSLYSCMSKKYIMSGFIAVVAFETHPMGIMACFYIIGYIIAVWPKLDKKKHMLLTLPIGGLMGIAYYLGLHWDYIYSMSKLSNEVWLSNNFLRNNILINYYFMQRYCRHIPEFFLLLGALVLFIKNKLYGIYCEVTVLTITAIIAASIIGRAQSYYMIYFYPILIIPIIITANHLKKVNVLIVIIILLLLPQYTHVYNLYNDYDLSLFTNRVLQEVPDDDKPVLGNPNSWYAFKDREFKAYIDRLPNIQWDSFYIVENKQYFNWTGHQKAWMRINEKYPSQIISSFVVNGETINIRYHCSDLEK